MLRQANSAANVKQASNAYGAVNNESSSIACGLLKLALKYGVYEYGHVVNIAKYVADALFDWVCN